MDGANSQQQARQYWISAYPFEPWNGGDGVFLECTTTSQRIALVGKGNAYAINNMGDDWAHLKFSDDSGEATRGSYAVPPGTQLLISGPADPSRDGEWTHVNYRAGVSTTEVQITRGFGN